MKKSPILVLLIYFLLMLFASRESQAQMVPSSFEQIDYLVTFGKESNPAWGDDDYSQASNTPKGTA